MRNALKLGRSILLSSCAVIIFSSSVLAQSEESNDFSALRPFEAFAEYFAEVTDGDLRISGHANMHVMVHDGTPRHNHSELDNTIIQLREASLFIDYRLSENVLLSGEVEFSYDFTDLEYSGRHERVNAVVNYAYFDINLGEMLDSHDTEEHGQISLRAGRLLVPFLDFNENKANFRQHLMSQPFTAWNLAPVIPVPLDFHNLGWSDWGLVFKWTNIVSDSGVLDLKLTVIRGLGSDSDVLDNNTITFSEEGGHHMEDHHDGVTVRPRDGLAQNERHFISDNNASPAFVAKLSYASLSAPYEIGASIYTGKWDDDASQNLVMYGVHFNYIEENWALKSEVVIADVEQLAGLNEVTAMGPTSVNVSTGDYQMNSWYVEASFVPIRYGNGERYLRLIARYDDVDTNDQAVFTPYDRSRVTLGVEWEFLQNVRMRFENQNSTIDDFEMAPEPYVEAGGREKITMNMLSLIAYF